MAKASAPPGIPTPICRIEVVRAAISPSLSAKSRRETKFRKNVGRTFFGVDVLLILRDAVFWDVSSDNLRFRQRADPLVVVGLLRGRVVVLLRERQLCVEQEAALFRQVSCRPLVRENVELPELASPLANSCEGDDGVQVFLPFASRTKSTHWRRGCTALAVLRSVPELCCPKTLEIRSVMCPTPFGISARSKRHL